jgi:rubrerythrin
MFEVSIVQKVLDEISTQKFPKCVRKQFGNLFPVAASNLCERRTYSAAMRREVRMDHKNISRRNLVGMSGAGALSAVALGVIGGVPALARSRSKAAGVAAKQGDIDILNVALGLEHEAIEAYQIGAESGLLEKSVLDLALLFQGQHKGHRDALAGAVRQLGGAAVNPKSRADYMVSLNIAAIKTQADILRLAEAHERGAANAYIGVIPSLGNKDLVLVAAKIAADEAAHWSLLTTALGDKLPAAAFMFG